MKFQKGKSGNPNGRPKGGESLTDILKEIGELKINEKDPNSLTYKKAAAIKWWQMALKGDGAMLVNLYRRIDGRERETVDANLTGDVNITINKIVESG